MITGEIMKKIVFTGGGTLGHIYPMIPVIKKLKNKCYLYFIGTTSGLEKALIDGLNIFTNAYYLDMQGFVRKLSFENLKTINKYFKCKQQALDILKDLKPDLVIGMGGYISGVVIKAALKLKIKTMIHEQNAVMGLANKMVCKKVNRVLLGLPLRKGINGVNSVLVGNPRITEIYETYKNAEEKDLIVVVGGSRGSQVINETIIALLPELKARAYRIVLITGSRYYQDYRSHDDGDVIRIIPFTNELMNLFARAALVISRSGATTISEILGLRKISILIPSPNVTNNHQEKNADILASNNCAVKITEKDLQKDNLLNKITTLLTDYNLRMQMKMNMIRIGDFTAREKFIKEMDMIL